MINPLRQQKEQSLHVYWYNKNGLKYYTIVCDCGMNRMTVHDNGIRCTNCHTFHSHDAWRRAQEKLQRGKSGRDSTVEQVPQPYLEAWERVKRQREYIKQQRNARNNLSMRSLQKRVSLPIIGRRPRQGNTAQGAE